MSVPNPTMIIGSSYLLYLAYNTALNSNGAFGAFEGFINGPVFSGYRSAVKQLLKNSSYKPLAADGVTRRTLPDSKTPPIYKAPPLSAHECASLQPIKVRGLTLRNRVIRGAAFDGTEVSQMVKTHEDVAAGGVGMTVVAYCSVARDGRTFEGQIVLRDVEDARARLRPVVDACHKHGAAICSQLTHAGSFAERPVIKEQQVSASAVFNIAGLDFPRAATKADIARLVDDFAHGAIVAVREIGFDAVELHCGHGYLLSQWMSPFHNRRTDEYGGSALNRARFPTMCLRAVRQALGPDVPILVKINANDGINAGLELPDALVMAEEFANNGADVLVVTCGNVSQNGMFMLRGASNVDKLALGLPGAGMKMLTAVFGPWMVPETPFETCFLRHEARSVLERVRGKALVCLMGGVDSLGELEGAMAEGFSFVQMIRPLIREPDFLLRVRKELAERTAAAAAAAKTVGQTDAADAEEAFDVTSKCIRCNMCVIASVDPDRVFGCPFRNMEVARQGQLSVSPAMARAMVPDLEDGLCQRPKL